MSNNKLITAAVILSIILVVALFSCFIFWKWPNYPKSDGFSSSTYTQSGYQVYLPKDYRLPSKEQIDWFNKRVYAVLDNAEINYPSLKVRAELTKARQDRNKKYRIIINSNKSDLEPTRSAEVSSHDTGPEVTMMFYLPSLNNTYRKYENSNDYEDSLIALYLHEYRHTQQDWGDYLKKPPVDWVKYGRESDARFIPRFYCLVQ